MAARSSTTCSGGAESACPSPSTCCLNGVDLRELPLVERKARLKKLLRRKRSPSMWIHVEEQGRALFERFASWIWRASVVV
jgi:hypothetical protein